MQSIILSRISRTASLFLAVTTPIVYAVDPVITNVRARQVPGTHKVEILYDLSADGPSNVTMQASDDGGSSYFAIPPTALGGDFGANIAAGTKKIEVNAKEIASLRHTFSKAIRFRVDANTDLSAGLVAYYSFDGSSNDFSGRGLHGSLNNGASYDAGVIGQSLLLDGVDDYFEATYPLPPTLPFTWTCWVKPAFSIPDDFEDSFIVSGGGLIGQQGVTPWIFIPKNNPDVGDANISVGIYAWGAPNFASSPPLSWIANEWHHLVFTAGDNKIALYIDGKNIASYNNATFPAQAHPPVKLYVGGNVAYIGLNSFDKLQFFHGSVDELRIYNRVISIGEITSLSKVP